MPVRLLVLVFFGVNPQDAALDAAIIAQFLAFYIEVFDGFSTEHGFAYEDSVMNFLGGGLGYLRQTYALMGNPEKSDGAGKYSVASFLSIFSCQIPQFGINRKFRKRFIQEWPFLVDTLDAFYVQ